MAKLSKQSAQSRLHQCLGSVRRPAPQKFIAQHFWPINYATGVGPGHARQIYITGEAKNRILAKAQSKRVNKFA